MRDKRFIAVHRGGPLTIELHRLLIKWACDCAEHVLSLFGDPVEKRLINALEIGKEWGKRNISVGDARNASLEAIAVARESSSGVSALVARCVGHAVASAHMADHSLRAADYALKAVKLSDKSIEMERKWQDEKLPIEIKDLVISARDKKHLKI